MTARSRHAVLAVTLAVIAVIGAGVGAVAVGAQAGPTVTIDGPTSIEPGTSEAATLQALDVASSEGVGSYELNLTYDPSLVSISADDAGAFTVETGEPADGVLRVVGYTGDVPGPNGTVALASLDVTGEATGTADVGVSIESLTDTDGDELPASSEDVSVTIEEDATETPDETTDTADDDDPPRSGNGGASTATAEPSVPTERYQISDGDPDTPGTTVRFSTVSVSEIRFEAENASGDVEVRDLGRDLPEEARDAPGSENVVRAVEINVSDSANGPASIRLRIPTDDLDGTDPANARIGRFVDDQWEYLETRLISTNGETVLEADSPGFSLFAAFKGQDSTPTATATTEPATDTATPEPATDTATATPDTGDEGTLTATPAMGDETTAPSDTQTPAGTTTVAPSPGSGIDLVVLLVVLVVVGVVLAGLRRAGKL